MTRRLIIADEAETQLEKQLDYISDHDAPQAALRLKSRFDDFLANHVVLYPATGKLISSTGFYETWIPKTPFVIWYRFSRDELRIMALWHTSQDRSLSRND